MMAARAVAVNTLPQIEEVNGKLPAAKPAVISWIDSDMKESPEELAHLFNSVFDGTIKELLNSIERAI